MVKKYFCAKIIIPLLFLYVKHFLIFLLFLEKGDYLLSEVLSHFAVMNTTTPYGNGHINSTFHVGDHGEMLLQRINKNVFKSPENVMENIAKVTAFMREEIIKAGGDPERETLNVMPTIDGKDFYKTPDGEYYRMYRFIGNTVSYDLPESPKDFENAGKGYGKFARLLDKFDINSLHVTIKDFHNTAKRYETFLKTLEVDAFHRASEVKDLIDFVIERASYTNVIMKELESGAIPYRVTHNDTKLNNILLDAKTRETVCVIDLDTVMPGSLLFDFGDAIRSGANHGQEDDQNLDNVYIDLELYEAFKKGYLSETECIMNEREKELLPFGAILMTFECGMRFLTDYLDGDNYFKTHRDRHNVDRAASQFKLVKTMEEAFGISAEQFK